MEETLKIERAWSMPNSRTFSIGPIRELIDRYASECRDDGAGPIIDPFSNGCSIADVTNDIDPSVDADRHDDATEFLRSFHDGSVGMVLYDPPYSPRQVSECYRRLGRTVDMKTTQASYWARQKDEIARVVAPGGYVITCSWNSGGIGMNRGFEIVEVLIVCHGGWHNDTICVVDRKVV